MCGQFLDLTSDYQVFRNSMLLCVYGLLVILTHYSGLVTQICVFNTVKLGTSASSP